MPRLARMKARMDKLLLRIAGNKRGLKVAQNRWRANHLRAVANHRASEKSQRRAKHYFTYGEDEDVVKAEREGAAAKRQANRARRAKARADYWVDRAKECNVKLHHLQATRAELETRIEKASAKVTVHFEENKVTGGGARQRVHAAMLVSMARAREFYSQVGIWIVTCCLTGPPWGSRYDCSSWFISVYWTCGLPDPSGQSYKGGWTGPLGEHGKEISEAQLNDGDAILFGYAPFFHVEMKLGPMSKSNATVGHGSAAVDLGTTNLLPGPRSFRTYI